MCCNSKCSVMSHGFSAVTTGMKTEDDEWEGRLSLIDVHVRIITT